MRLLKRSIPFGTGFLAFLLIAPACATSLNKSISISAGEESNGASTINGSISVASDAVVTGSVETVNGSIRVDNNARIEDAETVNGALRIGDGVTSNDIGSVNGSIRIGSSVTVTGEVSAVNGRITIGSGSTVSGDVSNVNGEITVSGAEIGGNISTVNGDVLIVDKAVLKGDLIIEKPGGWGQHGKSHKSRVIIGPGARVSGDIVLEQEVELFISKSAKIGAVTGVMSLDDAVRFSGDRP